MADVLKWDESINEKQDWEQDFIGIFGDSAKFEEVSPDGEYTVNTVLEDGVIRGGQEVQFLLKRQKSVPGLDSLRDVSDVYLFKKVVIAGVDLTAELPPECYFIPRYYTSTIPPFSDDPSLAIDWQNVEALASDPDNDPFIMHQFMQKGTFADEVGSEKRRILVMRVFTNADDVGALLHEGGHTQGGDIQVEAEGATLKLHNLKVKIDNGEVNELTSDDLTTWVKVVKAEAEADRRIIELTVRLRKDGKDLFPGEGQEMSGVRKFMQKQLEPYVALGNGMFVEAMDPQEIEKLVNPGIYSEKAE